MQIDVNTWINLNIENCSFVELAKYIIPKCEFEVRSYKKEFTDVILKLASNGMGYKAGLSHERIKKMQYDAFVPKFFYATKEEERDILAGSWDCEKNYEVSEMPYGFYFPDYSLGDLKRVYPGIFDPVVDKMITPLYKERNGDILFPKQLLYRCVFIILHEYGHYVDYKNFSNKASYAEYVYKSKAPVRDFQEKYKNGQIHEENPNLQEKIIYRECSDERAADDYALKNLDSAIMSAIEYLRKNIE